MISYRIDRESSNGTAFVRVNRRRPALSGRAAAGPTRALRLTLCGRAAAGPTRALRLTLTKRRAVDFCRVAAAL